MSAFLSLRDELLAEPVPDLTRLSPDDKIDPYSVFILWAAVLKASIRDAVDAESSGGTQFFRAVATDEHKEEARRKGRHYTLPTNAHDWMVDTSDPGKFGPDYAFTFPWVCSVVGLDPEALLDRINSGDWDWNRLAQQTRVQRPDVTPDKHCHVRGAHPAKKW